MTVLATTSSSLFPGSGNNGPFTWTWRFLHNSHIRVTKIIGGVTTLLTEGIDYAVAGAASYQGGSIITTTAVAVGETLKVERRTAVTQDLDLRNQGDFFPDSYEEALDKQAMIIQDQQRDVDDFRAEIAELQATVAGTIAGVERLYVKSAAEGPVVLPASGNVLVAKAAADASADPLHIVPGEVGQTIEGAAQYRDGLGLGGESVHLVFNATDNTWYKF